MSDPYGALARYYDAENAALVDDLPAYLALTRRFGGPVLDIGCGTGRVSVPLAEAGYPVVGIDLSDAMLVRARERVAGLPIADQIEWIEADIRTFEMPGPAGLAIFTYNGFMHFLEQADQLEAMQQMARNLKAGGGLVIDIANPIEMAETGSPGQIVLERTFTDDATGQTVMQQSVVDVDRAGQIMSITWIYDRLADDGQMMRTVIPVQLRYTSPHEMTLLMQIAGFESVEVYGDYQFNAFEEDSPRLLVVGVKAA